MRFGFWTSVLLLQMLLGLYELRGGKSVAAPGATTPSDVTAMDESIPPPKP